MVHLRKKWWVGFVLLAVCAGDWGPAYAQSSRPSGSGVVAPKSLAHFVLMLEDGLRRLIDGDVSGKAFAPVLLKGVRAERSKKFVEKMNALGIVDAKILGMEFELLLHLGGKVVYRIKSVIAPSKRGFTFLEIRGSGTSYGSGLTMRELQRSASFAILPIKQMMGALQGPSCARLELFKVGQLPAGLSERFMRKARRGMKKTRKRLEKLCKEMPGIKFDEVRLRVDDVIFFAFDKGGKVKGGFKTDLRVRKGRIWLRFPRFRAFPK